MKNLMLACLLFTTTGDLYPQALPIYLDGRYDDWTEEAITYQDIEGDGNAVDFQKVSVANDNDFLFFRLNLTPELKLIENNNIKLYIDGDNDSNTGLSVNGIGAELEWNFGTRNGTFHVNSSRAIGWVNIRFRNLPTVWSTENEIAIGRDLRPDGANLLFTSDTIKILFEDPSTNGDLLPNAGEIFSYTFDPTPVEQPVPIMLEREEPYHLRIMDYNIRFDSLLNPALAPRYDRILNAIQPDIICFNEFFNSSAEQVRDAIDLMLPLDSDESWHAVKLDAGNVTISKYPIIQS